MYTYRGVRKHRKKQRVFNVFLFVILAITSTLLLLHTRRIPDAVISPLATDYSDTPPTTPTRPPIQSQSLEEEITAIADGSWSNYSIYIEDYNSDFKFGFNEAVIFDAASVNKIPILAALYYTAQTDESLLDQEVTPQPNDIQAYGTGVIQYDSPGTSYTVKTLARLMMQKSDNTAAFILAQHTIGVSNIQKLIEAWGLTQTDMNSNKTSNIDMSILMKKIYTGEITSRALTLEMLSFLKDSDFEDRIPALLPDSAVIYHKIGNAEGGYHDVGIVQAENATYYIGIFTYDVTDDQETIDRMAELSRVIYDALTDS